MLRIQLRVSEDKKWDIFIERLFLPTLFGELAQLARALAWQARGHRFESGILHLMIQSPDAQRQGFFDSTEFRACSEFCAEKKTATQPKHYSNPLG